MLKIAMVLFFLGMCMNAQAETSVEFDSLWNFAKPAETESKFRELLLAAKSLLDKDSLLQLQTQIARSQGLQGHFEEAHHTLNEVESSLDSTTQVAKIRYLLERGRVFNSSKNKDQALPFFQLAFQLATQLRQDNLAVDTAHMVAIALVTAEE